MDITEHIAIHAAPHPVPQVQRAGFPLDHPYMDQAGALRIFDSLECASVAAREALR